MFPACHAVALTGRGFHSPSLRRPNSPNPPKPKPPRPQDTKSSRRDAAADAHAAAGAGDDPGRRNHHGADPKGAFFRPHFPPSQF